MKDITGREITVGSTIAHPLRVASSAWINVYRVLEIQGAKAKVELLYSGRGWGAEIGRRSTVTAGGRSVLVEALHV